jgi:hypothetical protein
VFIWRLTTLQFPSVRSALRGALAVTLCV